MSNLQQYFEMRTNDTGRQITVRQIFNTAFWQIENELKPGSEKSVALRKLLESMDAAMRSVNDRGY